MIFSKLIKALKRKSTNNTKIIPCYNSSTAFCDTVEGCTLWNWDRDHKTYNAVQTVFKTLPPRTRDTLAFSPGSGQFCERAQFWRLALKTTLPSTLYYSAMRAIYCCYKRIKELDGEGN